MSAKPGSLPRWANSGGAIVVPPSGTLDVGYVANAQPLHSYDNWYQNLVYQWIVWLNDGDCAFNNLSAASLAVTGAASCAGFTATGAASMAAVNASGLITANAGLTAAANQHIAVSGSGLFKHGTQTMAIPTGSVGSVAGLVADEVQITGGVNGWRAQVMLPVGKRITAFRVRCLDSATGPTTINGRLYSSASNVPSAALGTTNTSSGAGTEQTLSTTGLTIDIAALTTYFIVVGYVSGSATCKIHEIEVDYVQL